MKMKMNEESMETKDNLTGGRAGTTLQHQMGREQEKTLKRKRREGTKVKSGEERKE